MSFVTAASRPNGFPEAIPGNSNNDRPPYASSAMPDHSKHSFYNGQMPPQMSCEIKPRLTKEQHDILEAHFLKQNKPNTQTKKNFADSLNVSLDKINNWFQNRRAKLKQDAKKQAGGISPSTQNPPSASSPAQQSTTSSTGPAPGPASSASESASDASPLFASSDYFGMMQSCSSDEHPSSTMSHAPPPPEHPSSSASTTESEHSWSYSDSALAHLTVPSHFGNDMFDSNQDLNRRTLTQEQFDAFAQNAGLMRGGDDFSGSEEDDVLHQFFPDMGLKRSDDVRTLNSVAPPLSSRDSSIPSSISEQSLFLPGSHVHSDYSSVSTTSSDWTDSRSSSVSGIPPHDPSFLPPASTSSAQWQPGQSIPVDPTAQYQQFREAAQARHMQSQTSSGEQHMVWPADHAFARRESQSSALLAQQMSSFGLQTPAPSQDGAFKAPPPPASIAARRQRPRPAALGLASLRSQSYSGAGQAASPGPNVGAGAAANPPQLRRIRSVNVLNGVAPGRVMKSTPGSAQRSPLNWTFADAMVSPKALRHSSSASIGSLAPPTPMSPRDPANVSEHVRPQFPPWQSSFSRQASISETDDEHNVPLPSASAGFALNFSSPPHTPMFQHPPQPQFMPHPPQPANAATENTPPQSAPAAQQTFPTSAYMLPPQAAPISQQVGSFMAAPPHAYMTGPHADSGFRMPAAPPFVSAGSGHAHDMPMQFTHGLPVMGAQGNLAMAFPHPMQFVPHPAVGGMSLPPKPVAAPAHFNFVSPSEYFGNLPIATNAHKPSPPTAELFVHEYSPPSDVKRSHTPRKTPADSGPKNYTFTNHGPEHFEKDKAKKAGSDTKPPATASESSASAATA